MNNIFNKIFPEPVSCLIMRFNIHPIAELFIEEKQKQILREPRKMLKLYKTKLRQLHNYDKKLDIFGFSYIILQYPNMINMNL